MPYAESRSAPSPGPRWPPGSSAPPTARTSGLLEAGDGPPVVLLPGTLSSGLFWLPLLPKLRGLHAIAPDRPGQGLSDPAAVSEAPTRQAAVAWVDRLLDALELPTVTLVGHSMGGLWGLWFALPVRNGWTGWS